MRYANISDFSKRRVHLFWLGFISRLGLLFGVPFLIYYGYCWGVWGRNSLLFQYLFQCECPTSSEEWRYPEEVEVIVSACRSWTVTLSPMGSRLYIREKKFGLTSSYLLDFQTEEKIPIKHGESYFNFITDELLYRSDKDYIHKGGYVLDGITGIEYPIRPFRELQPNAYQNGNVNSDLLLHAFLQFDKIILLDTTLYPVIALSSDFRDHPEHSFVIYFYDFPGTDVNRGEQFLQQNKIIYDYAPSPIIWDSYHREVLSPDGRLIARTDGVYLVETNQMIVGGISRMLVNGWTNDGRVVYSATYLGPCLLRLGLPFGDDTWCEIVVPQPVLLLKVPEE